MRSEPPPRRVAQVGRHDIDLAADHLSDLTAKADQVQQAHTVGRVHQQIDIAGIVVRWAQAYHASG